MIRRFKDFLNAFPSCEVQCVAAQALAREVERRFQIDVPQVLVDFWSTVGSGYFADRELYFFGDADGMPRDSLIAWNSMDYWSSIFPQPRHRGPFFFAETCFGAQIGFRWEGRLPIGYLLDVDTLEAYRVANDCDDLFDHVLTDRFVFSNPLLLRDVRHSLGDLPDGMHYAPIVSPLARGSLTPDNYHLETPNVHLRTSIATWQATQDHRRVT